MFIQLDVADEAQVKAAVGSLSLAVYFLGSHQEPEAHHPFNENVILTTGYYFLRRI